MLYPLRSCVILLVALLGTAGADDPALANNDIHILAETADMDMSTGLVHYRGNVTLTQPGLRLVADELIVNIEEQQIQQLQALGSPAVLEDSRDPEQETLILSGHQLFFDRQQQRYQAEVNAEMNQGAQRIQAQTLDYYLTSEHLLAQGQVQGQVMTDDSPDWLADTDEDSPIQFSADRGEWQRLSQEMQLQGHAFVQQGTFQLEADNIDLVMDDQGLLRLLALGSPSRSQGVLSGQEHPFHLEGLSLDYRREGALLVSRDNAILTQNGNRQRADVMTFWLDEQSSQAQGNVRLQLQDQGAQQ